MTTLTPLIFLLNAQTVGGVQNSTVTENSTENSLPLYESDWVVEDSYPILIERGADYEIWDLGDGKFAWSSVPLWVFNGSEWVPYIYENTPDYYQVQSGLIGARIYDNYAVFYSPDMSEIRVYDERWEVERWLPKQSKWDAIGAQFGTPTFKVLENGNNITLTKTFNSWTGTLVINYIFREGSPLKHEVIWTSIIAENTTFRVLQRWAGIVGSKVRHNKGENEINSTVTVDSPVFEFRDNNKMTVLELQSAMYYDENGSKLTEHTLKPVIIDTHAKGMKTDFIFENWTLMKGENLVIDPDTMTLSSPVEDGYISYYVGVSYTRFNTHTVICFGRYAGDYIERAYIEWDVSSIPDGSTITNTVFKYHGSLHDEDAHIHEMLGTRPSTSSNNLVYAEAGEGTVYADPTEFPVVGTNQQVDLGTSADTDLQNQLPANWFAIGIQFDNEDVPPPTPPGSIWSSIYASEYGSAIPKPTLYVIYTPPNAPPNAPTSLLCEGQTNPSRIFDTTPEFSAIGTDPDGDQMNYYALQVDDDSGFGSPIWNQGKTSITAFNSGSRCSDISYGGSSLTRGTTYYWRIEFWDNGGAEGAWSTETATFKLNRFPNTPSSPSPPDDATNQPTSLTLSWSGGDPDGDSVTYDVYFEANDSIPELVSDDQIGTTYNPGTLDFSTHYYWKIDAKDEHGETTEGPVWDFTTKTPVPPVADFTCSPSVPMVDEEITFADQSSDSDGTIVSRSWDFGDDSTSSDTDPTHSYVNVGNYSVTLTVTDDDGLSDSITKTVLVEPIFGREPTPSEKDNARIIFPNLVDNEWWVTGKETPDYKYNCYAWSVGINENWLDSDPSLIDKLYGDDNGTPEISDWDNFYAAFGYSPVSSLDQASVILYVYPTASPDGTTLENTPSHGARRYGSKRGSGNLFESKCGRWLRIVHEPNQLENGRWFWISELGKYMWIEGYGRIERYYDSTLIDTPWWPTWNTNLQQTSVGVQDAVVGTGEITVYWDNAFDAEDLYNVRYNMYYDNNPNHTNTITHLDFDADEKIANIIPEDASAEGYDYKYTITGLTNEHSYYVGVRAEDQNGNEETNRVEVSNPVPPTPVLVSPENNSSTNDNTPTFDWTSVEDPLGITYTLQYSTDPSFVETFKDDFAEGMVKWNNFGSPSPGTFQDPSFWDGWGYTTNGDSNYSSGSYSKTLIDMTTPFEVEFRARQDAGGTWDMFYNIGIGAIQSGYSQSSVPIYFSIEIDGHNPDGSSERTDDILYRSYGSSGYLEDAANDHQFHTYVMKYNLTNVEFYKDGSLVTTLTIDPAPYDELPLVINGRDYNDTNYLDYIVVRTGTIKTITTDNYTVPDNESLANGIYYWHVKAVDGAGNASDWSTTWALLIDTNAPAAPSLLEPENDSRTKDITPTFDWTSVEDPSGVTYTLQYSTDPSFVETFEDDFAEGMVKWNNFGSPSPGTFQDPSFWDGWGYTTNGDGWYSSGSYSKALIDMTTPFEVEFRARQDAGGTWDMFNNIGVGAIQSGYSQSSAPIYFSIEISGHNPNGNSDGTDDILYRTYGSSGFLEDAANDHQFHTYVMKYNLTNVEFYKDGSLVTTLPIDPAPYDELPLVINGRDYNDTNYLDYIVVRTGTIKTIEGITTDNYTVPDDESLANGTYYWRVRAVDGVGNLGDWADNFKLTVIAFCGFEDTGDTLGYTTEGGPDNPGADAFGPTTSNPRSGSKSFEAQDTGKSSEYPDNILYDQVDVSSHDNVWVHVWIDTQGNFESSDYIRGLVQVDNGTWTEFFYIYNDRGSSPLPADWTEYTYNVGDTASTVRVKLEMRNSSDREIYYYDDVSIT